MDEDIQETYDEAFYRLLGEKEARIEVVETALAILRAILVDTPMLMEIGDLDLSDILMADILLQEKQDTLEQVLELLKS